jgi:hypothetical protein
MSYPLPIFVAPSVGEWLARFGLDELLRDHVAAVIERLPGPVREDFLTDSSFALCDYEPGPGVVVHVPVGRPRGRRRPGRAVVLKRTLRHRRPEFIRYIIAHELAHAHLHNLGRFPGDDPEHAADALAEQWGFPRPCRVARPAAARLRRERSAAAHVANAEAQPNPTRPSASIPPFPLHLR